MNRRRIELDNGTLNVVEEGRGDVLLLVHGFPLDHSMWSQQIAALRHDYRVVAPDLRGFGQSSPATVPLTMEQHADDLAQLLDKLEIVGPVHFCGLSMGGYIAWQFWKKYTQLARSLLFCDTKASADAEAAVRMRLAMAKRIEKEGHAFVPDAMLPKLVAARHLEEPTGVVEQLREMILNTAPASIAAGQRGMAERIDATAMLPKIDVPSLVLVGEHDSITTAEEMRTIAESLPEGRFVEILGAGHMAPMEEPAAVNKAMQEFLATA